MKIVCIFSNDLFTATNREPQYFQLVSLMNDKVLDIEMGTTVIMGPWENGVDAQLWFEDRNSQIRHKTSDKVLDTEGLICLIFVRQFIHLVFNDVIKLGAKGYSYNNTPNCTQTEIHLQNLFMTKYKGGKAREKKSKYEMNKHKKRQCSITREAMSGI